MTPPTNIKEYRKWKKEQYRLIEYEIKEREADIERLSPFYDVKAGNKKNMDAVSILSNDSDKYEKLRDGISKGGDANAVLIKAHKRAWEILRSLVIFDKGISKYGVNDDKAKDGRDECILDICSMLADLSAESKYYFLKKLCDFGELSALTEARIGWDCYYENNDMKSDFTYKIGRLLVDRVDYDVIGEVLEWEIQQNKSKSDTSIRSEMSIKDAVMMQELRDKGDLIYVYRGFLVEQDEYVRAGRKEDGEAYYLWSAGKGLSFTFNKEIAHYFCFFQMKYQELKGKNFEPSLSRLSRIPDSIKTKEEWIEATAEEISQFIDRTGKKPIVGRFLIEPIDISMLSSVKNEAEVNLAPEKVLLVDYQIVSSKKIAEEMWKRCYASWTETADVFSGINESKIIMLNTVKGDGIQAMFAEVEAVKDDISKCKQDYLISGDYPRFHQRLIEIFTDNAVEIPNDINTRKSPTTRLWDFLTRNEERLVRKRAQSYVSSK